MVPLYVKYLAEPGLNGEPIGTIVSIRRDQFFHPSNVATAIIEHTPATFEEYSRINAACCHPGILTIENGVLVDSGDPLPEMPGFLY